jgi:hypothetical protein
MRQKETADNETRNQAESFYAFYLQTKPIIWKSLTYLFATSHPKWLTISFN